MFEIPDYTGRDPNYIKSSLQFLMYHATQTLCGKKKKAALEAIREKAAEHGIKLD